MQRIQTVEVTSTSHTLLTCCFSGKVENELSKTGPGSSAFPRWSSRGIFLFNFSRPDCSERSQKGIQQGCPRFERLLGVGWKLTDCARASTTSMIASNAIKLCPRIRAGPSRFWTAMKAAPAIYAAAPAVWSGPCTPPREIALSTITAR